MNEFKGTKGRWEVTDSPYVDEEGKYAYHGQFDIKSGETTAARVHAYNFFNIQFEEAKANAQLISKAPEMLEALEEVLGKIDWSYESFGSTEGLIIKSKIEQVIKEATTI